MLRSRDKRRLETTFFGLGPGLGLAVGLIGLGLGQARSQRGGRWAMAPRQGGHAAPPPPNVLSPTELGHSGPTYPPIILIFCSSLSVRICNVESYFTLNQTAIMCHSQFDSIGTQNVQPTPARQLHTACIGSATSEGVYCLAVVGHGS